MSSESSISYAALILADAEQEITSDKLLAITKAAGAQVDSIWADVFAKALEGKDLKELLFSFAASAPASGAAAGGAAAGAADAGAAPAEEAKEEEDKEESDDDMGFGLFD
ncbi:RPP1B [Candida margitis]|uniref:RPP1B n=1 Tax=Candida margitis TaxID=1775924 RepID=UPI002227D19E|nr:RPP1B [Candida margitis]KAI5970232.1 RPP1B [Candida margitis]